MPRQFLFSKDNFTKNTLLKIAKGGIIVIAITISPYALHKIADSIFKDGIKKNAQRRARKIKELEKRKLIRITYYQKGEAKIELTHKGKSLIRRYDLDRMKLTRPRKWDKQWRIVIYDIPQKHKRASSAISKKLHEMGLYRLQKSIWICPYECLAELEFICTIFKISFDQYFHYFTTTTPPDTKKLKKFFKLAR